MWNNIVFGAVVGITTKITKIYVKGKNGKTETTLETKLPSFSKIGLQSSNFNFKFLNHLVTIKMLKVLRY